MGRVIVSGATGFIGYHLVRELLGHGDEVYAICRQNSANLGRIREFGNVRVIVCGLGEIGQLYEKCKERGFDVFYHLAWQGASGNARMDSVVQANNMKGMLEAVKSADLLGCSKFVATGTVCEYQCRAIVEKNIQPPSAFYLLAKEASYKMVKIECLKRGIPLVWCTFYHPIGKYNKPDQFIASVILKLMKNESPQVGPADKWFDIIDVEDLSRGLYLAGKKELQEDRYFIGSGNPRILKEYLEDIRVFVNAEVGFQYNAYSDDGLPMEQEWLDAVPFMEAAGFRPNISFLESLERMCKWLKSVEKFI